MLAVGGVSFVLRRKIRNRLADLTQRKAFTAVPALLPHDPAKDRVSLYVARGGTPAKNVDDVLSKLGGIDTVVGTDDVVIIKVSAQWWNQGMTNVAAVKRVIETVLERPGFAGEVIVFENTHFRRTDGTGLTRAWQAPSVRNVDVAGWHSLGDLVPHFASLKAPVSFVGLVDAGHHRLSGAAWHDPKHEYGVYGGDGRGPIEAGSDRDGYHWDFDRVFSVNRSWFDDAKSPLTWPRFTSPRSKLVVDLRDGVMERKDGVLRPTKRKLTWINMTTANEHSATGFTGACKSTMGIVDMTAGELGTHSKGRGYRSAHYFGRGSPSALWRMAGPLAQLATHVREPDLILTVAEWVGFTAKDLNGEDLRHSAAAAAHTKTIVAGTDPVAIDTWCCNNLMNELGSTKRSQYTDLSRPSSRASKFLRYYRSERGRGTMDPKLITVG